MSRRLFVLALAFSLGALADAGAVPSAEELARATIVVYNKAAPDSPGLARFYAGQRHIPNDHLVGLDCSTEEEISREEYDQSIAEPLRKIFRERHWWTLREKEGSPPAVETSQIKFVALIKGMPLKIRATAVYPGDQPQNNEIFSQNEASVDSELTVLGLFSAQISGVATNPYFQSFRSVFDLPDSPLLLVSRLDGPSAAIVRRMISDSLQAEKKGLRGRAFIDGAANTSGGRQDGDEWLTQIVKDLRRAGVPVVFDQKPEIFPAGFPVTDCALYYGWYATDLSGALAAPGFAFQRGAIAVHIHSFSAQTVRSSSAHWVGPLLAKGAAASLGNVYEPYLQMTTHLDIFNDRLLHGFTLAESAWMGTRALSWMNVVVGDPLYRPYLTWLQLEAKAERHDPWQTYHEFALANANKDPAEYLRLARQTAARTSNGAMLEDLGLMQKEAGDFAGALSFLEEARTVYGQRGDLLRTAIEQVETLVQAGRKEDAVALIDSILRMVPDTPSSALLRKMRDELRPPPATPSAGSSSSGLGASPSP